MNEELKDRGLKKAVREQTTFRLPSNFTYRTMQKVEEAIRQIGRASCRERV